MSKRKKHPAYPVRVPRPVSGGIRAQLRRSQAPRSWWAKRWLAYMESLGMGARLGRGRSYAISGQVADLAIGPGCVEAVVQGAGPRPYHCRIECHSATATQRRALVRELLARPMLLAQLLVRNLPVQVETLFRAAGCPLLPSEVAGLRVVCDCPDPSPYCKHGAAVMFILGETVGQDPLLLLEMRGLTQEDIFGASGGESADTALPPPPPEIPARCDPASFWGGGKAEDFDYGPAPEKGSGEAPLARRLGGLPFWRGEERFIDTLAQCGARSAEAGWRIWAGDPPPRVFEDGDGLPPGLDRSLL